MEECEGCSLPSSVPVPLGGFVDLEAPAEATVRALSCVLGECHGLVVSEEGHLFTWGNGSCGALGLGDFDDAPKPSRVRGGIEGEHVVMACPGFSHVLLLTRSGQLWVSGTSFNGELGTGLSQTTHNMPTLLQGPLSEVRIEMIACGCVHSLALENNGRIWAWGENECGQLGCGDSFNRSSPTLIQDGSLGQGGTVFIACSTRTSAAVSSRHRLFTWGDSQYGKLALGGAGAGAGKGGSGDVCVPCRVPGLHGVRTVACHEYLTLALVTCPQSGKGCVMVWGGVQASVIGGATGRGGGGGQMKTAMPSPLPLGVGDVDGRVSPTRVGGLLEGIDVVCVAAAKLHLAAVERERERD